HPPAARGGRKLLWLVHGRPDYGQRYFSFLKGTDGGATFLRLLGRELLQKSDEPLPAFGLLSQGSQASPRNGVILRVTVVLGLLPYPLDPAPLFQAYQCRIECALVEDELAVGDLLQSGRDCICVLRPHRRKRFQYD